MRHIEFPAAVLAEVDHDRFRHPDPAVQRRMQALRLKAHGQRHADIAELSGLSRATVQRVLDKYLAGGLAEVRSFHWHAAGGELDAHQADLAAEFEERPPHTVAEACDRIERRTGVRRSPTRVRRFLRDRLDLRWRPFDSAQGEVAAIPLPPKQTPAEHAAKQAEFLKGGP
jgi:transposase